MSFPPPNSLEASLKTPLFQAHVALKAKMIPFGGWMMPVSYEGVLAEHKAVREHCGLFDVSHMGEIRVKGPQAEIFLQSLTINDIGKLSIGGGQYSAICNDDGGMIDDLIIYRLDKLEYFICVNASNRNKDFDWIHERSSKFDVKVTNESDLWGQIAVQGPRALDVLSSVLSASDSSLLRTLPYTNIMPVCIDDSAALIARTGYTGEFGFEVYLPSSKAENFWMTLLENGARFGVKPIGLGARDTLRLEACYLLYGNDMNERVTPLEAGIAWATKLDKGDFIGRPALLRQKTDGLKRQMFAFKMEQEGIPRHDMVVYGPEGAREVGSVTSGSVLPTVGGAGGLALLDAKLKIGDTIYVDIRGAKKRAVLTKRPLYIAKTKS